MGGEFRILCHPRRKRDLSFDISREGRRRRERERRRRRRRGFSSFSFLVVVVVDVVGIFVMGDGGVVVGICCVWWGSVEGERGFSSSFSPFFSSSAIV